MSRPVKDLITQDYQSRFGACDGVVVINGLGINAKQNDKMRTAFAAEGIRITVVKNTQAKRAVEGTALEAVGELLDGACAFVYTTDENSSVVNVARLLMEKKKKELDFIEVRGAVMENSVFANEDRVKDLSNFPTREEAIAQLVGAMLGPGSTLAKVMISPAGELVKAFTGPAGTVAALLKAVEEKGGEVAKVA